MSGGSYEYLCYKVQDFSQRLEGQDRDPRRAAFAKLMHLVSEAMHDIEWVDSCDYGPGSDHKSIDAVFAFLEANPSVIKKAHAYDALADRLRDFLK